MDRSGVAATTPTGIATNDHGSASVAERVRRCCWTAWARLGGYGVDPAEAMVSAAAGRFRRHVAAGRLELHAGSLERLPLGDAAIDGAITINTISFVSDLSVAFQECARVLRPGGQLIVELGDPAAMRRMPVTSHGSRLRPVAEVDAMSTTAGLSVVDHRRVGTDDDAHHLLISATPT